MARVLPEILSPVDDVPFAAKVVDSVRNTLSVDVFLGTRTKVLLLLET